jgi:hypothetical protein
MKWHQRVQDFHADVGGEMRIDEPIASHRILAGELQALHGLERTGRRRL